MAAKAKKRPAPAKAKALPELQLGVEAKDVISGIFGIVTSLHEHATGMIQFGITPKAIMKGDAVTDYKGAYMIDPAVLKVIGRGEIDLVTPASPPAAKLGQVVECETSGVQGTMIERVTFLNGCMYNWVQPRAPADKTGEKPKIFSIANQLTKVVGDGISAKTTDPRFPGQAASTSGKPPGGPTMQRPEMSS